MSDTKLCPVKYKNLQCLLTDICELSQSMVHLSEANQKRSKAGKAPKEAKIPKEKKADPVVKKKRNSKTTEAVVLAAPATPGMKKKQNSKTTEAVAVAASPVTTPVVVAKKSFVDLFAKKEKKSETKSVVVIKTPPSASPIKEAPKTTPTIITDKTEAAVVTPRKSAFDL